MTVRWRPRPRAARVRPARRCWSSTPTSGRLLTGERRARAEHELRVRVTTFPVGEWDGERLADAEPTHLGLLLPRASWHARWS